MPKSASIAAAVACGAVLGFALGRALPTSLLRAAGSKDPTAETARALEILNNADPLERASEFGAFLRTLGPDAVPALQQAFDKAPTEGGDVELVLFGTWWAAFDPNA